MNAARNIEIMYHTIYITRSGTFYFLYCVDVNREGLFFEERKYEVVFAHE